MFRNSFRNLLNNSFCRHLSTRQFNPLDPFLFQSQLTTDELLFQETARKYANEKLMPRVKNGFRNEVFDRNIMKEMGELLLVSTNYMYM